MGSRLSCTHQNEKSLKRVVPDGSWSVRKTRRLSNRSHPPVLESDFSWEEVGLIRTSWKSILQENPSINRPLIPAMCVPNSDANFEEVYYDRLFSRHSHLKSIFKDNNSKKRFIIPLVSCIVHCCDNMMFAKEKLEHLTYFYSKMGLRSHELGNIGETLLWTLRVVLKQDYSHEAHTAWGKLYDSAMKIMLPLSVAIEKGEDKNVC